MIFKFIPEAKTNSINVRKTNPIGEYSLSIFKMKLKYLKFLNKVSHLKSQK